MTRVRTTFSFGQERIVLIGEVDRDKLATQMKAFSESSRHADWRSGQVIVSGKTAVSSDTMACINALTPDGGPPMSPDPEKVQILHFSRLVYRAGE